MHIQRLKKVAIIGVIGGGLLILAGIYRPTPVLADSNTGTGQSSTSSQTGTQQPTGADASTYQYNPSTGLWENAYYTWSPITHQTTPKTPPTYTYNPATGMWDMQEWDYDAANGTYVQNTVSVASPPAGAIKVNTPPDPSSSTSGTGIGSNNPSAFQSNLNPNAPTSIPINNTSNNSALNSLNNSTITNQIDATSQSGNALVGSNTQAGNATTGNSQDIANLINLLQSSGNFSGNNFSTFVSNILGTVNGDLLIDPSLLLNSASTNPASQLQLQSKNSGQINNNLNLSAASGNAGVDKNTIGGNATSGSANAIADVVNLIDSIIAANKSFLGVVNIYGNFNGNILIPSQLINSLLASNQPNSSQSTPTNASLISTQNNNESVNNLVSTTASSGQASVTQNTNAGNATSGNALTKVNIFNLTGDQVIGQNSILVFVNVLGTWVGLIMNAPPGTTAAAFGGGISQNTTLPSSTNVNSTNNEQINNNIKVAAASGNASVTQNTNAGNATSGNATASVNLLNILGSQFSLSNWFGILFINVFGSWHGNFGIDLPASVDGGQASSSVSADPGLTNSGEAAVLDVRAFKYAGSSNNFAHFVPVAAILNSSNVLGASDVAAHNNAPQPTASARTIVHPNSNSVLIISIVGTSMGLVLFGVERYIVRRQRRQEMGNTTTNNQ